MTNENYILYQKAMNLSFDSKYVEAIKIIRQIEDDDPIVKFMLAKLLLKTKKTRQEGVELLKSLLDTTSRKFALLELGKVEYALGHYDEAEEYLVSILKMKDECNKKDKAYVRLELGKVAVMKGNNDLARRYFNKLLKGSEKDISCATLELAKIEELEGNIDRAKKLLFELVEKDTQNALYALYELGKIVSEEEDYVLARAYFDKLLRIGNKEDRALARFGIAKLELQQGHHKTAYMLFEKLEDDDEVVKGKAKLELGKLDVKNGDYEKARNHFTKLLDRTYSDMLYATLELGKLAVVEKKYDIAKEYFNSLLNTSNKEYALLELGRLAVLELNYEEARDYFEKLLNSKNRGRIWAIAEIEKLNSIEGAKTIIKN